jgi:hypothetical protein|tara:strand:- start:1072 stop:1509 length:438 start_codon:yes stop_codon:yes gene_type:complete
MKVLLLSVFLLSSCAWIPKFKNEQPPFVAPEPIVIKEIETVPLRIYQPPLPGAIDLLDVNFFVITEENLEEQMKVIEKMMDGQFVVFSLLPDGYEKMAENFQEVRRYIRQQKELIIYYRNATSESEGTNAEDWADKNEPLAKSKK